MLRTYLKEYTKPDCNISQCESCNRLKIHDWVKTHTVCEECYDAIETGKSLAKLYEDKCSSCEEDFGELNETIENLKSYIEYLEDKLSDNNINFDKIKEF